MAGLQSPISWEFVAAGIARRARMSLMKLGPSQVNAETPSWEGHGGVAETMAPTVPIADRSYWENRYVLTELTLEKENADTLVINDAVVSISREKRIVRTALTGLDGTIKEYICNGDYDISIAVGIVAVDGNGQIVDEYPEEGIIRVNEFLEENRSIAVSSVFLGIFGISRMVVTRFSLRQETASNRQTLEIRALSDVDYEIKNTEY
jgi:hypothetical protein